MADVKEIQRLEDLAYDVRRKLLHLCNTYEGAVHIGGDLSSTDMMVALWHHGMKNNPENIKDPERDRFFLSAGHKAVLMYTVMAQRGFWDYEEMVKTYGKVNSAYGMHPCRVQLPALECSSGSLGQGLAMGVGTAISAKVKGEKYRTFVLLGDGETAEGEVWEAAQVAASQKLGNLTVLVDRNKQFMTSYSEELIQLEPYPSKWTAFGFNVVEVNGHDMGQLIDALDNLPSVDSIKPTAIICNTRKGKGVNFMEHIIGWHAGRLDDEDLEKAVKSLNENYPEAAERSGK